MPLVDTVKSFILSGGIDFSSDALTAVFVRGSSLDPVTYGDIPLADQVGSPTNLSNVQVVQSSADLKNIRVTADNTVFSSVSGDPITQLFLYHDATGTIIMKKTLDYTPTGSDITVSWGDFIFEYIFVSSAGLYAKGIKKILEGAIDFTSDTIKVALVDTDVYIPDYAADEFHSDLSAGIVEEATLSNITLPEDGVVDGDDILFTSLTGNEFELVVIFKDTGVSSTSPLIGFSSVSFTPVGDDLKVVWNSGTNRILAI